MMYVHRSRVMGGPVVAKNKDADQPVNLRCMVGAFAVRCPDSAIDIPATSNISRL